MKTLYHFDISVTLRGPILTKGTSPGGFGFDAVVARDFISGKPMLPGTLVEGKIREALHQLGETALLDELFGRPTEKATNNDPARGCLIIGDLLSSTPESCEKQAVRVALENDLGSAKGEMLRVLETPYRPGAEAVFVGTAVMYCTKDKAAEVARLLRMGLLHLEQVGSNRTTGFGVLTGASVEARKETGFEPKEVVSPVASLELEICPQGPLCVSKHKIGTNLFESEDFIPGNMLAGAIMQTAKELGIAIPDFDKLRFLHAYPAKGDTRPRPLPHSTVKVGKIPYDIALFRDPVLLRNDRGEVVAPEFPVDWKSFANEMSALGWAAPARELRVRTALDSAKRTADKGENGEGGSLFGWEMIHPVADPGRTPVIWRSRIDLKAVADPAATATALARVLPVLGFVSKTKAQCPTRYRVISEAPSALVLPADQQLALVLHSPALLADPRFQDVPGIPKSGPLSAKDMLEIYRAVWVELSGDSLILTHHFARQFLAGGNHLAFYFQKKRDQERAYDPWLLTDTGSVFVFTVKDATVAGEKLKDWFATGLPLPQWAEDRFGSDWRHNPYRPQNGFGEVSIHTPAFATPITTPVTLSESILPTAP